MKMKMTVSFCVPTSSLVILIFSMVLLAQSVLSVEGNSPQGKTVACPVFYVLL